MRLAILNLTGGGISGGYRKYLSNILPRLSHHPGISAVLCASPRNLNVPSWFGALDRVTFVNCAPFSLLGIKDTPLHARLDAFRPDVIFIPLERYFTYRHVPTVCMPQNMLPMSRMRHSSVFEAIRNRVQKVVAQKAVARAQRTIAISGFVADFLQREWRVPSQKIGVVSYGVGVPYEDEEQRPSTVPPDWDGRFIFTAGAIESYRGLEDILHAAAELKRSGLEARVVIAGSARPSQEAYNVGLHRLADTLGLGGNVCWTGMLMAKEMAWCYRNAQAYAMTSRIEACPNTALEAMSYGKIIISSSAPPMPEFFGKTALYYEAGNAAELAGRLAEVFSFSDEQKTAASRAAAERAREFSWEDTASKTVAELLKAIAR